MAWNVKWQCALLALVVACSKDDDDGGSETDAVDCDCMLGAYVPACGVDGMTYDATCGTQCVPVEVACMGECPCGAGSTATSGEGTADGTGESGASETSETSTTMGLDPCDCMLGAYVPACGVDGMTYDATCGLECVPVDVLCMAECPCPEIQCGDRMTCGPQAPVCSEMIGGPAGSPTTYACDPLPAACDGLVPTCACVGSRGCECVEDPPGYFHVTCAAP